MLINLSAVNFLKKVINRVRRIPSDFIVDNETSRFIEHNKTVWGNWKNSSAIETILFDFYGVCETEIARSYFLNILARKHQAVIKSFSARRGRRVIHQSYRSFNVDGHIVTSLSREQKRRVKAISNELLSRVRTKQELFDLDVLGLWIGIDIYESYLSKYNKPTADMNDPRLFDLVENGIGLVVFWQDYFASNNVAAVVLSHDCYLAMNVVSKVAYQKNIPVYLPNARGITLADEPFSVHKYFLHYRTMFNKLPEKERNAGVALAKIRLEQRFNGEIGVDMPYATQSGYLPANDEIRILKQSDRLKVLICSHCFFDNPHPFRDMLFLDFYEWLHYLGRISERTDYDWYLKMHPDPLPGTQEVIGEILKHYPRITQIPYGTSHHQLIKEGIDFVLTVYGSVGHEYPALGAQVINAGYNPHVAYDFNWTPKSLEEYEYWLLNLNKLHKAIKLEELYEFYYMNYYYVPADTLIFRSHLQLQEDLSERQRNGSAVYGYFLDQLTGEKHQEIIDNMKDFIDFGSRYYFSHGPEIDPEINLRPSPRSG